MTVAELSARSGIAPSALRFYEAQGLLAAERSTGNQRRYRRSALRRVAIIRVARAMGVPLADVAAALGTLPEGREPTTADWARLSASWHAQLTQRITVLERLRDDLGGCIGCGCLSLKNCRLFNADDHAGADGDGPRFLLRGPARGKRRGA